MAVCNNYQARYMAANKKGRDRVLFIF